MAAASGACLRSLLLFWGLLLTLLWPCRSSGSPAGFWEARVSAVLAPPGPPAELAGALAEEQLLAAPAPGVVAAAAGPVAGRPGAMWATQLGGAWALASKSRRRLVVLPEPVAVAAAAVAELLLRCLLAGAAAAGARRLVADVLLLLGSRLLAATVGLVTLLVELLKLMCCLLPGTAGRTEPAAPAAAVMPGRREAAAVPGLLLCSLRMVWNSVSASVGSEAFHLVLLLQAGCSSRRLLLVVLQTLAVGLGGADGPMQLLLLPRCSAAASSAAPAAAAAGILLLPRSDSDVAVVLAT
jgi:hypothetical protein